jgi:hypothetical protein
MDRLSLPLRFYLLLVGGVVLIFGGAVVLGTVLGYPAPGVSKPSWPAWLGLVEIALGVTLGVEALVSLVFQRRRRPFAQTSSVVQRLLLARVLLPAALAAVLALHWLWSLDLDSLVFLLVIQTPPIVLPVLAAILLRRQKARDLQAPAIAA